MVITGHEVKSTRPTPLQETLDWREQSLAANLTIKVPAKPGGPVGLERGNRKLGQASRKFDAVLVWNLPAMLTCPGRSGFCSKTCYTGDPRPDVFPVGRWTDNLAAYRADPEGLRSIIGGQLAAAGKSAVRLHSSGDFFEAAYVRFWASIVRAHPATSFWGYTRSWVVEGLRDSLEELRAEPNMRLFASWDATMPAPPEGWRMSRVVVAEHYEHRRGAFDSIVCPEQTGVVRNCAECGYCITKRRGGIIFFIH